jgi:hypothetical protein
MKIVEVTDYVSGHEIDTTAAKDVQIGEEKCRGRSSKIEKSIILSLKSKDRFLIRVRKFMNPRGFSWDRPVELCYVCNYV